MANAKKEKSGNWRVQIYIGKDENGKKHKKSFTAPTKWEAEKAADDYLKGKKKCNLTVGKCIDNYIEIKENVLSPSTVRGYKQIRKGRLQLLMNIDASRLTAQDVQQAVSSDALRLSQKSILEAVHLMTAALKLQGIHLDLNITYPPKKSEIKILPEPQAVINAIMGTSIELPCLLAICLGLRCSEIRALTKSDLKDNILYVHRRKLRVYDKDILQDMNKTNSSCRSIKCSQLIVDKINACETEDLCPLTYPQLSGRFRRLMKANNLDITFHGLRHINATVMRLLNIPDKYAMERGGWSSTIIMKENYQNIFSSEREQADSVINEYFDNVIKNSVSRKSSRE